MHFILLFFLSMHMAAFVQDNIMIRAISQSVICLGNDIYMHDVYSSIPEPYLIL